MRVRNIFICSGVVFCASSRMTKALFSVRPRMKASGAISMALRSNAFCTRSWPIRSHTGVVQRAQVGSTFCARSPGKSPGARRPPPPGGSARCAAPSCAPAHPRRWPRQIGLAGARRANAEGDVVRGDVLQVQALGGSAPRRSARRVLSTMASSGASSSSLSPASISCRWSSGMGARPFRTAPAAAPSPAWPWPWGRPP